MVIRVDQDDTTKKFIDAVQAQGLASHHRIAVQAHELARSHAPRVRSTSRSGVVAVNPAHCDVLEQYFFRETGRYSQPSDGEWSERLLIQPRQKGRLQIYLRVLRRLTASPAKPTPSNASVTGSGIVVSGVRDS